jgi:subtilisin family serine protease
MFSQQWHLTKIGAPKAWDTTTGSSEIVVAHFDTGVDYTHPDLAPNMWRNPGETGLDANGNDKATNGIDDDGNGYIDDVFGIDAFNRTGDPMDGGFVHPPAFPENAPAYHGTWTAGVIGAVGNNGLGICGVNWSVKIMSLKIWSGDDTIPSRVFKMPRAALAAWEYIFEMKKRGVNIRVVTDSVTQISQVPALRDAIKRAGEMGILVVAAAGNDNALNLDAFSRADKLYNLPSVILVANSTSADELNSGSDFGKSTVHLAAPGTDILMTTKGGGYATKTGTSFSTPLVAGSAALLLAANPNLTMDELKAALLGSVDRPTALRNKTITGGRLSLARAMEYIQASDHPAIVITSLPAGQRTAPDAPLLVTFSRAMNIATVESSFTIAPALAGRFVWTEDHRSFQFVHDLPFARNSKYQVRILGSALDESGGTLDGNFNRVREGSPLDDYSWSFSLPVANDDFEDADLLTGASGAVSGTTRYSTWQFDTEPVQERFYDPNDVGLLASVWYRWTPDSDSWFTFDLTITSSFDSYLAVCKGDNLSDLVTLARNDNYGSKLSSRVSFHATGGTRYAISILSKNGGSPTLSGPFKLAWFPTPSPGLTGSGFSPSSAMPGSKVTLTGTNFTGATVVLFNGASATFTNAPADNLDLKITATVPANAISGPITIITPHGNVTSSAAFTVIRPALTITRIADQELNLSWAGSTFSLESSADLRVWNQISSPGAISATIAIQDQHAFFRLRTP